MLNGNHNDAPFFSGNMKDLIDKKKVDHRTKINKKQWKRN